MASASSATLTPIAGRAACASPSSSSSRWRRAPQAQQVGLAGSAALAGARLMLPGLGRRQMVPPGRVRRDRADLRGLYRGRWAGDVARRAGGRGSSPGLGLGGMVPIEQALITEYAPARIRGRVASADELADGSFRSPDAHSCRRRMWAGAGCLRLACCRLAFIIRRRVPSRRVGSQRMAGTRRSPRCPVGIGVGIGVAHLEAGASRSRGAAAFEEISWR